MATMGTLDKNAGLCGRRLLIGGRPLVGRSTASEVNDGPYPERREHLTPVRRVLSRVVNQEDREASRACSLDQPTAQTRKATALTVVPCDLKTQSLNTVTFRKGVTPWPPFRRLV